MQFCAEHWQALRDAIEARGLNSLIAESGEEVAKKMFSELEEGSTVDNFDPLMGAHNAIVAQAMQLIPERYGQNPMMIMADPAEHPEWACPICALNWCHEEHLRICTQEDCDFPKEMNWVDEMINGAADFMLSEWEAMKLS